MTQENNTQIPNTKPKDNWFLKMGEGEFHVRASSAVLGVVAGLSLAFSLSAIGSSHLLSNAIKGIPETALKCSNINEIKNCAKEEIHLAYIHKQTQLKIDNLSNTTSIWAMIFVLSTLSSLNTRTTKANRKPKKTRIN